MLYNKVDICLFHQYRSGRHVQYFVLERRCAERARDSRNLILTELEKCMTVIKGGTGTQSCALTSILPNRCEILCLFVSIRIKKCLQERAGWVTREELGMDVMMQVHN